jgi:hypothetical protein
MISYTRVCVTNENFSDRGQLLLLQGYNVFRLKSSFRIFCGDYNEIPCDYKLSLGHMLTDLFHIHCCFHTDFYNRWSHILLPNFNKGHTSGMTNQCSKDAYSSAAPDPALSFVGCPCCPTPDSVFCFWLWLRLTHFQFRRYTNAAEIVSIWLDKWKLIRYQFWCTRCAFWLLQSLQWCSSRKGLKSEKKYKNWKSRLTKTKQSAMKLKKDEHMRPCTLSRIDVVQNDVDSKYAYNINFIFLRLWTLFSSKCIVYFEKI